MPISASAMTWMCTLLRERTGISLDASKAYLVESRLLPIAQRWKLSSVDALVFELRDRRDPGLTTTVLEALTTNETLFFRDDLPFAALREHIVPALVAERRGRPLRFWSAAGSTGQEAYSIAMLMLEHFPEVPVEILSTDVNRTVTARAQEGLFRRIDVERGLAPELLAKYFHPEGTSFRALPKIRSMVQFRVLNLTAPWPAMGPFDVVLVRNVLIYFDLDTKAEVLARTRQVLVDGGWLLLGAAETPVGVADRFERVRASGATVYRALPAKVDERPRPLKRA